MQRSAIFGIVSLSLAAAGILAGCHPLLHGSGRRLAFTAIRLQNPLGGAVTEAFAIDDQGRVAGRANQPKSIGAHSHAMVWQDNHVQDLGTLDPVGGSEADAITTDGKIYGWSSLKKIHIHGVWFSPSGPVDLGVVEGEASQVAAADAAGQVILVVNEIAGMTRSYLMSPHGTQPLGTLPGYRDLTASDMNANSIVGTAGTGDTSRAFIRPMGAGTPSSLDPPQGWVDSYAYAIGKSGDVAGAVSNDGVDYRAVVWESGKSEMLPAPSSKNSQALGINDAGDVVGTCNGHACLWRHGKSGYHKLVDLNSVCRRQGGDELETAVAINNHGAIVCNSSPAKGLQAYLLTPNR